MINNYMALFGSSYLNPIAAGSTMHDYQHASKLFRSNGYANAPKYKFLFYVNFVLNSNVSVDADLLLMSYLVKNVELPKFDMEIQEYNQYNKKVLVQSKIKYTPISIKFHDDNANQVRLLWQNYYNYYFGDGQNSDNDITADDKYTNLSSNLWGMNTGITDPFFDHIEIYSMASGNAQKITIFNPMISHFSHDSHDYADGQSLMEHTMTLHYTTVTYEDGYAADIPGFADSAYYDTTQSNIASNIGQVITSTGSLSTPTGQWTPVSNSASSSAVTSATQQLASVLNQTTLISSSKLSQIASTTSASSTNSQYVFPTTTTPNIIMGASPSSLPPVATYATGTWQNALSNKGYTPQQIQSATSFISSSNLTASQTTAEDFLQGRISASTPGISISPASNLPQPANVAGQNPSNANTISSLQTNLQSLGYSTAQINAAIFQLNTTRIPSSVNPTTIAQQFLNNSAQSVNNATNNTTSNNS